ncbi:F-box protein At5g07610-like [Bidens hawaiensis]|uniref:F-box protein At5g07610-like n=1 Tax=Bidens hawaiensis TaxID=980011 RepID=UPI00404964CC
MALVWSMALAFHPTQCVHYKVVCVRQLPTGGGLFQIQIYSSDTRKWKISIESFSAPKSIFLRPVYWNRAIYWPPYYGTRDYFYFKIDVEQLLTFPVPEELVDDEVLMYFGESRGHLHSILPTKRVENSLVVYEMLMDCSGWFVKYQVQLDKLLTAFPTPVYQYSYNFDVVDVVDVVRGKEEEDAFLVVSCK